VKRTGLLVAMLALLGPSISIGCGVDDPPVDTYQGSTAEDSTTTTPVTADTTVAATDTTATDSSGGSTSSSSGPDPDSGSSSSSTGPELPPAIPVDFVVTVENVSSSGLMWSPLSPGVWANHDASVDVLFEVDQPDDDEGLQMLAEDGNPSALVQAVADHNGVAQTGVFDTPEGAGGPGPILPGDTYQFTFTADPGTRLSLATMLGASNDLVVASGPAGIGLFAGNGQPLGERNVTTSMRIYDAGTERNQAPGQGPWQAVHGGSPDIGLAEAPGVGLAERSTRAIPLGPDLVSVTVDDDPKVPGTLIVTITNVSQSRGALVTPFSSLVWAMHADTVGLFAEGAPASPELEALAEDGAPNPLDGLLGGMAEVGSHGVAPGLLPGESIELVLATDPAFPMLSFAAMVGQTNDAFLAMGPGGVQLVDGMALRSEDDIEADILAALTAWDAGTEANEVPGAGLNQAPRQLAPDTGPDDAQFTVVGRYSDVTNDLAGNSAGGRLEVTVDELGGDYTITITNVSETTAFPGLLSPTVWALHDDTVTLFDAGMDASPDLELLAEDGDPSGLLGDLMGMAGVDVAGVVDTPLALGMPGPLPPGDSYVFTVTPGGATRFLSFAGMIQPSNDTFAASQGVALLDAGGVVRPAGVVAGDIATALQAWDAGTEGDQAGAAGRDMAPTGMPDTGPSNGNGLVREADEDEIWSLPEATGVIRVTVAPVE
jgi:hypothetical protein